MQKALGIISGDVYYVLQMDEEKVVLMSPEKLVGTVSRNNFDIMYALIDKEEDNE